MIDSQYLNQVRQWYVKDRRSILDIARRLAVPLKSIREIVQEQRWVWKPLKRFARRNLGREVIVFDLETSGLPRTLGFNQYYPYTDMDAYEPSRILQLAYCRYRIGESVSREAIASVFRAPEGFQVSDESFAIHKLSTDWLIGNGKRLEDLLPAFLEQVRGAELILSHNTGFDLNILKSEMYRMGYSTIEIEELFPDDKIRCTCTMTDFTRLGTLYSFLPEQNQLTLHDARDDVLAVIEIINFLSSK